ncbi:MAG: amidohydrolase family protein [Acidobacteria bacterium]|nr:amidohydrolase family protein [Acidobacteriota bacterium]
MKNQYSRREFVQRAASAVAFNRLVAETFIPAIDTHTHFYDPARPQGVPWPKPEEKLLYQPYYPPQFVSLTQPLNVVGTVVVEASPWVEDNQWILDLAKEHSSIVAFIGNLKLGQPEFAAQLKRFSANPLFRGLRLSEGTIVAGIGERAFEMDIQRLGERAMTLDVLGGAAMLPNVIKLAKLAPRLRIVIDHLPFAAWDEAPETMRTALGEVARLPQVYAKVSNVVRRDNGGNVITDLAHYRASLDVLWQLFGADRLVYGSNWPVSERVAPYVTCHQIVAEYFNSQGKTASEKFFWRNSRRAYGWLARGAAKGLR